jgi:hypothetical protein
MVNSSPLRPYQGRVLDSLFRALPGSRGAQFTVMLPRQAGKNEISARLIGGLLLAHGEGGGSVIVCAPTLYPQARISLERTRLALLTGARYAGMAVVVEENSIRHRGAVATFLSASPAAHVAGHTASIALIADEAQDIDADWFDRQFRPMAASTGAPTVLFGTPWDGSTLLERAVEANRLRDERQRGRPYLDWQPRHHQVDWTEVAGVVPEYGAYVEGERARLGPANPLYLSQYELVASRAAASLFDDASLVSLRGSHPVFGGPVAGERYVGGLDFGGAGEGADATVLTVARLAGRRCEVVAWHAWQGAPFNAIVGEVAGTARRWGLERLAADETGLGGPLVARLRELLGRRVVGVVFSASSKSELGWGLVGAAGSARLALPRDDGSLEWRRAWGEVETCRRYLRPGGQLGWGAPPGRRDDYVASLALCLWAADSAPAPRIARGR